MTKIIDNEEEKLCNTINKEMSDVANLAFASAYFNIGGFELIKETIMSKPLRFLIGRPQDESITFEEEIVKELEEREDDLKYYATLNEAIDYFSSAKVEIRKIDGPFFHGKVYLGVSPNFSEFKQGVGILGSSNFTYAGLSTNNELNVLLTDRELVGDLIKWFNKKWSNAKDYKDEFLSFMKNYTFTHTPYEVAAKALYEYYKNDLNESENIKLLDLKRFQAISVIEAKDILSKYHGVIIADSTGLGKTRTMLALAHEAHNEHKKVLLIAPKNVLDTTWKKEMEETDVAILNSVNTEFISANPEKFVERYGDGKYNFIIVDEAHDFRSPSTNRYNALKEVILRNRAEIVLATATPVNNSLMDLYSLISLFADENSIMDLTNTTLKGYFTNNQKLLVEGKNLEMSRVLERFIVRHSRKFAQTIEPEMKFPKRVIDKNPLNYYKPGIDYSRLYDLLKQLRFMQYDLSVDRLAYLKLPNGQEISKFNEEEKKEKLKALVKTIVILNIFKRLESSHKAFIETLNSISNYLSLAKNVAERTSYFLPRSAGQEPLFDFDEQIQEDLLTNDKYNAIKEKCLLSVKEKKEFIEACDHDINLIKEILGILPNYDPKLNQFLSRMKNLLVNITDRNGIIVFSQYTATAKSIYEEIKKAFTINTYLTTGTESNDERGKNAEISDIVKKFQKNGGILISTDVLSEGQNLQNAQYVVNYDFPWNPVVLIQRVGRIDRLGSPYNTVYLINIMQADTSPDSTDSLEHFINLMRKLYLKIASIRTTIGIDAPILGEEAEPKDFGKIQKLIADGNNEILTKLEGELEQFVDDPKDKLMEIISREGEDWLKKLPQGIGAYKKYHRNGVFSLFTDGEKYYWRLKFYDDQSVLYDPNRIVSILLEGDSNVGKGKKIDYNIVVEKLKTLKEETLQEMGMEIQKLKAISILPKLTLQSKKIYERLAKLDEDLALKFRGVASKSILVKSLYDSLDKSDSEFLEKAHSLIESNSDYREDKINKETKLRRVCWCFLEK